MAEEEEEEEENNNNKQKKNKNKKENWVLIFNKQPVDSPTPITTSYAGHFATADHTRGQTRRSLHHLTSEKSESLLMYFIFEEDLTGGGGGTTITLKEMGRPKLEASQVKSSSLFQKPQWGYMKEHQWKNIW